jgi:cell division protein FtsB
MPPITVQKDKGVIIVICVALFILGLLVYYAPYGCHHYLLIREDLDRVTNEIDTLKGQNQELKDEITLLKSDTNYIEKIARQKLGMLKKNEIVFESPEKKGKKE